MDPLVSFLGAVAGVWWLWLAGTAGSLLAGLVVKRLNVADRRPYLLSAHAGAFLYAVLLALSGIFFVASKLADALADTLSFFSDLYMF